MEIPRVVTASALGSQPQADDVSDDALDKIVVDLHHTCACSACERARYAARSEIRDAIHLAAGLK